MKIISSLALLILLGLSACKQGSTPEDFEGYWVGVDDRDLSFTVEMFGTDWVLDDGEERYDIFEEDGSYVVDVDGDEIDLEYLADENRLVYDGEEYRLKSRSGKKKKKKTQKEMLAGDWVLADIEFAGAITDEQKEMFEEMTSKMKGSMRMEFNKDGTYKTVYPNPFKDGEESVSEGKWSLSSDGKTLTTEEDGKSREDNMDVKELTDKKLKISAGSSTDEMFLIFKKR